MEMKSAGVKRKKRPGIGPLIVPRGIEPLFRD